MKIIISYHQHNYLLCFVTEVHSCTPRQLRGFPPAIKIYKFKLEFANTVMGGQSLRFQFLILLCNREYKMLTLINYMTFKYILNCIGF
jgi:hypothetical protein